MAMDNVEQAEYDMDILQSHVNRLMEHFDSVQILVTRLKHDGSTMSGACGAGDVYARIGKTRDWLVREDERTRNEERDL